MTKTLWELTQNEKCRIGDFNPVLDESYRVRLMELGFHPGETVTCIYAPSLGAPKLYRVHNTVYSLDDNIAKLVVTEAVG